MEQEVMVASSDTLATLNKSEIDQQVATAHKYPRSIKSFRDEATQLVTLNEQVAGECIYSLPRAGKTIEGPSARFAEVLISSWGNCRAGARVISEDGEFVTAQGVFHDLEKNSAITYEVKRRIVDKNGRRFKPDMIAVTANAACSIALRNAALKGVPKAFWSDMYDKAREVVMGDVETLGNRRANMLSFMQRYAVTPEMIFQMLEIKSVEEITLDHMVTLRGVANSLKDGTTTAERIQEGLDGPTETAIPKNTAEVDALNEKIKGDDPADKGKGEKLDTETGEVISSETEEAEESTPNVQTEAPAIESVLAMIEKAATSDDLDLAGDIIRDLSAGDAKKARTAITAKRKLID